MVWRLLASVLVVSDTTGCPSPPIPIGGNLILCAAHDRRDESLPGKGRPRARYPPLPDLQTLMDEADIKAARALEVAASIAANL